MSTCTRADSCMTPCIAFQLSPFHGHNTRCFKLPPLPSVTRASLSHAWDTGPHAHWGRGGPFSTLVDYMRYFYRHADDSIARTVLKRENKHSTQLHNQVARHYAPVVFAFSCSCRRVCPIVCVGVCVCVQIDTLKPCL